MAAGALVGAAGLAVGDAQAAATKATTIIKVKNLRRFISFFSPLDIEHEMAICRSELAGVLPDTCAAQQTEVSQIIEAYYIEF
jgi:hypothetical protein